METDWLATLIGEDKANDPNKSVAEMICYLKQLDWEKLEAYSNEGNLDKVKMYIKGHLSELRGHTPTNCE